MIQKGVLGRVKAGTVGAQSTLLSGKISTLKWFYQTVFLPRHLSCMTKKKKNHLCLDRAFVVVDAEMLFVASILPGASCSNLLSLWDAGILPSAVS